MATLEEKIELLEDAMAAGVRVVSFDGHRTEYQDISEMQKALSYFQSKQRAAAGKGSVSVTVGAFSRG